MSAIKQVNPQADVIGSRHALLMNISAAKGLADVVKSNLGPRGTMKMYHTQHQHSAPHTTPATPPRHPPLSTLPNPHQPRSSTAPTRYHSLILLSPPLVLCVSGWCLVLV